MRDLSNSDKLPWWGSHLLLCVGDIVNYMLGTGYSTQKGL